MASAPSYNSLFDLNANEQDLLIAALNSQGQDPSNQSASNQAMPRATANGISNRSPAQRRTPGSSGLEGSLESPLFDDEQEDDLDGEFDTNETTGQMIGSLPGGDLHEKRKSFDGANKTDGGGKRQETDEKKKPGRRPLTTEPTTKRKAQNRAAQRAFRERKEQHLKDLENKVADLEKVSESTTSENNILKAQVKHLQEELQEYRQRLTNQTIVNRSPVGGSSTSKNAWENITFDFPSFGMRPSSNNQFGVNSSRTASNPSNQSSLSNSNQPQRSASYGSTSSALSQNQRLFDSPSASSPNNTSSALNSYTDLFSPNAFANVSMSPPADFLQRGNSIDSALNNSRSGSLDNVAGHYAPSPNGGYALSNSASPSASSVSQHGPGSSTGTSPEPSGHSPATGNQSKTVDTSLKTISEEANNLTVDHATSGFLSKTPSADVNSFNWLAQQNDGQFAPDLFGDYREPQDAVATATSTDLNGFFNEAFLQDLSNWNPDFPNSSLNAGAIGTNNKRDILSEMDAISGTDPYLASQYPQAPSQPAQQQTQQQQDRQAHYLDVIKASRPTSTTTTTLSKDAAPTGAGEEELLKMNQIWSVAAPSAVDSSRSSSGTAGSGDCASRVKKFLADRSPASSESRDTINRDTRVQNGEFDIDNLCKEMTKKAKCTEHGLKVPKKDVDDLLNRGAEDMFSLGTAAKTDASK